MRDQTATGAHQWYVNPLDATAAATLSGPAPSLLTVGATELPGGLGEHIQRRRPLAFAHGIAGLEALSLDAIADLAEELGPESLSADQAVKPLVGTVPTFEALAAGAIADRIRSLAENDSWFTLLNIEQSPRYARLVDELLDAVADAARLPRVALRRRMGFVFASSPRSVTAAHFDLEHSVLLQLRGERVLGFGRFNSAQERETEIERFWDGSFGRVVDLPAPVSEVQLRPGSAAYIPPYHPHWLCNGDQTSLSLTVTFFERSNEDESAVQVLNHRLRRWGLHPRPYDPLRRTDRLKAQAVRGYGELRRRVRPERPGASSH